MMDNLDAILAIWEEWKSKLSPTMMDHLDAILAIWEKVKFQIFSNDGG